MNKKDVFPISYSLEDIYSEIPLAKLKRNLDLPDQFKDNNPGTLLEDLNSSMFRCDEFKKDHSEKHILFSGDSYTWGTGLLKNEVWSKVLYDKISSDEKCSGYFNLGFPGSSIINQIFDMFKYFRSYGNPDLIFFNLTELSRFYSLENDKNIYNARFDFKSPNIIEIISYQYYFLLEQYCISNNIKLYSFSWKHDHEFNDIKSIKTFHAYQMPEMISAAIKYIEKNSDKKYLEYARDNKHLGLAYHNFWAEFIYERYINDNIRN